jgi:hypothetical protein
MIAECIFVGVFVIAAFGLIRSGNIQQTTIKILHDAHLRAVEDVSKGKTPAVWKLCEELLDKYPFTYLMLHPWVSMDRVQWEWHRTVTAHYAAQNEAKANTEQDTEQKSRPVKYDA